QSFMEESGKPGEAPRLPDSFVQGHLLVPLGWPGYGAMQLAEHKPWSTLTLAAVAFLAAGLGLTRAYRMTMRFYRAAEERVPVPAPTDFATVKPGDARPSGPLLVERRLPWIAED